MRAIAVLLLLIAVGATNSQARLIPVEEAPLNETGTDYRVQYIFEGDMIMVRPCQCIPPDECDERNSVELIRYKCSIENNVCCIGGSKRTNHIE